MNLFFNFNAQWEECTFAWESRPNKDGGPVFPAKLLGEHHLTIHKPTEMSSDGETWEMYCPADVNNIGLSILGFEVLIEEVISNKYYTVLIRDKETEKVLVGVRTNNEEDFPCN